MSLSPCEYLGHVLDEAAYLAGHVEGTTREQFLQDETAKRAFVRSLEIIGEAVKQVPQEMRDRYPDIEWRAITGMRDKMAHHYFGVDYEIVWDAATHKVPVLRTQISDLLEQEGKYGKMGPP